MSKLESRRGANIFNHRMRETHSCKDDHGEEVILFLRDHFSTFYGSSYVTMIVKCKGLPGPREGLVNTVWPPIPKILGLYIADDRSWRMTPFVWQIHWYATRVTRFHHVYQAGRVPMWYDSADTLITTWSMRDIASILVTSMLKGSWLFGSRCDLDSIN